MQLPTLDSSAWSRLAPYFDRALELAPLERETWLADLTTTEPDIAQTVRQMLRERDLLNAQGFLTRSPLESVTSRTGSRIGPYTIDRLLGCGGMGEVWLAKRSDGRFEGACAIKFLEAAPSNSPANSKLAERFRREGQVLARLTHPNIARLLDAGTTEDGAPYLALEYVDGQRIDVYCDAKQLSIVDRVRLFVDVIGAVAHAHTHLVIHRDLKPSNVLVTHDGYVKLLDFGIAKLLSSDIGNDEQLTRVDEVALTPEFAAPEQVLGELPSTATDVYQLGMLLYVLLTGQHPLQIAGARAERMRAALDGVVPPASTLPTLGDKSIRKHLQGDLDAILAKALRKLPSERYATAQALQEDIQRYLSDEPVHARRGAMWYRARKFVARHRVAVAAAGITLCALIAGIVGTTWQAIEAQRARSLAEAHSKEERIQRDKARFEERLATANQEFVSQIFGDAMRGGESSRMRERLDRARNLLRVRYAAEPEVHAMLLMQLAGRYAELQAFDREADVMAELRSIAAGGSDLTLQAQLECIDAYDLISAGDLDRAAPHVERGLALTSRAGRPLYAAWECWRAEAMLAAERGDAVRADARMKELLQWIEREGRQETRLYLSAVGSHAHVLLLAGNWEQALLVTRKKLALDRQLGSDETLSSYMDSDREAALLFELGRVQEAALLDKERATRMAAANEEGQVPLRFLAGMTRRAVMSGEHRQAVASLVTMAPEYARTGPEAYARGTLLDLADAQMLVGNSQAALAALQRFESRLAFGPVRPPEAIESSRIGLQLAIVGRAARSVIDERRGALSRALALAPDVDRIVALKGHLAAGFGAIQTGSLGDAMAHANQALTLAEAKMLTGKTSAWVGAAQLLIAQTEFASKHVAAAQEHLTAARLHLDSTLAEGHWLRAEIARMGRGNELVARRE